MRIPDACRAGDAVPVEEVAAPRRDESLVRSMQGDLPVEVQRDDVAETGIEEFAVQAVARRRRFMRAQLAADERLQLFFRLERLDALVQGPAAKQRLPFRKRSR